MELALVARALKNIPLFMIIEPATEVCAFSRQCPASGGSVKEKKAGGDEKTGTSNRLIDSYICWFFGYFIAGKL